MELERNLIVIGNEDLQCGRIYLNGASKMLKYLCAFCDNAYNDMSCFSNHLICHFNEGLLTFEEDNKVDQHEWDSGQIVDITVMEPNSVSDHNYVAKNTLDKKMLSEAENYNQDSYDKAEQVSLGSTLDNTQLASTGISSIATEKQQLQQNPTTSKADNRKLKFEYIEIVGATGVKNSTQPQNPSIPTANEPTKSLSAPMQTQLKQPSNVAEQKSLPTSQKSQSRQLLDDNLKTKIDRLYKLFKEHHLKKEALDELAINTPNEEIRNLIIKYGETLSNESSSTPSDADSIVFYKCKECEELFNSEAELKLHIESVHYTNSFECKLCSKTLWSKNDHRRHMHVSHFQNGQFYCEVCEKTEFENLQQFQNHCTLHKKDTKYICDVCGKIYKTEVYMQKHIASHSETVSAGQCSICGQRKAHLSRHMKIHSPGPTPLRKCPICERGFTFSSGLSRHIKVMHKIPRINRGKMATRARPINANCSEESHEEVKSQLEICKSQCEKIIEQIIENQNIPNALIEENTSQKMDTT